MSPGWKCARLSEAGSSGLAEWLEALAMDPADFHGIRGVSFTALRRELGWLHDAPHPEEERLSRAIGSALLHGDDPDRLRALAAALSAPAPPQLHTLGERERRAWLMLTVQLFGTGRQWRPLDDALAVLWQAGTPCPGRCRCRCVGVLWHEPSQCDLLFVTLKKSEALFSPTTRYRRLAHRAAAQAGHGH